jgi:hypothetical protein
MEPTFTDFRDGTGGEICRRMGIDISGLTTWRAYTDAVVRANDKPLGSIVEAARKLDGTASSGERAVLHAALAAADFAWLAQELDRGNFWERTMHMGNAVRRAVAAAVLRTEDETPW